MNALIVTALWGVLMMFGGVTFKRPETPKYWAIAGMFLAFIAAVVEIYYQEPLVALEFRSMIGFNSFNLTFIALMLLATTVYFLLNGRDIERVGSNVSEYFALIFFVQVGVILSASFNNLLTLFLGIEILSIPLYILTGSDKRNLKSNEAALKYFLMGSFSTGIFLLGIAFLYGGNPAGSFSLAQMELGTGKLTPLLGLGLVFLLIALSFKVSAAPFHFWTPDVYDGAPTVFTSFMATIVKAAAFMAFLRLFQQAFGQVQAQWQLLLAVITAATLFIGNITAVFQQSVKRMLAYSSIAQAGFMLFAVFALNDMAKEGLVLYAAAYSLASIGLFAVLIRMKDYTIEGFNGLAKSEPWLAVTATIFLLSLTGIPATAGFQAKFYMLMAALKVGTHKWLVVFAVLCAAVSAYYYFRVIQAMFFRESAADGDVALTAQPVSASFKWLLVIVAAFILLLGVAPGILTNWLHY